MKNLPMSYGLKVVFPVMKRWLVILVPILLVTLGAAGYGIWWTREQARIGEMTYEEAYSAYQAGEYRRAFQAARRMAERGDIRAQTWLAWLYQEGYGTDVNDTEAFNWYLRAADAGHLEAMVGVMYYYRSGRGPYGPDLSSHARWAEQIAERGDVRGQIRIGAAYLRGEGVAKDFERGLAWLQQAADAGSFEAMSQLALAYKDGTFGDPDYERALSWYQTAVKFGDEWAMLDMVRMLNDELLPIFNLEQSYFWALVGTTWAREGSAIPRSLAIEILDILYQVPDGIPSGTVNISGLTGDGLSPDPSPFDYDYESWPRRLGPEAQRRVEADVQHLLARWPQPPMTE